MTDDKPKPYHSKSEMRRIEHMKEQKPDQPSKVYIKGLSIYLNEPANIGKFRTMIDIEHYDALQKRCEELEQFKKMALEDMREDCIREQALVDVL